MPSAGFFGNKPEFGLKVHALWEVSRDLKKTVERIRCRSLQDKH